MFIRECGVGIGNKVDLLHSALPMIIKISQYLPVYPSLEQLAAKGNRGKEVVLQQPKIKPGAYCYDTPKERGRRDVQLGLADEWSFVQLERLRDKGTAGTLAETLPMLLELPENFSDFEAPRRRTGMDPLVVTSLADVNAHREYRLPPKPPLDEGTEKELKAVMGDLSYVEEKFPQRLLGRKAAFVIIFGDLPRDSRWDRYFSEGGLRIDFRDVDEIPASHRKNRRSKVLAISEAVDRTIEELRNMGIMEQTKGNIPSHVEHPTFTIPASSGELRLIVDCSSLAPFIVGKRFRYEDYNAWLLRLKQGDWLWHLDLKKAYYLIKIHKDHRKFFGFNYVDKSGIVVHMEMQALAMGCNPAPEIFTSFDKILIQKWRTMDALNMYPYMDDTTGSSSSQEEANRASRLVAAEKAKIGQVLSLQKCTIEATQVLQALGFVVRTAPDLTIEIAPHRVEGILGVIKGLLQKERGLQGGLLATAEEAAIIGGLIDACRKVLSANIGIRMRALYNEAAKGFRLGYEMVNEWHWLAEEELLFFYDFFDLRRGPIRRPIQGIALPLVLLRHFSDASKKAHGSFLTRYLDFEAANRMIQGDQEAYKAAQDNLLECALNQLRIGSGQLESEVRQLLNALRPLLSGESLTEMDAEESSLLRELIPILVTHVIAGEVTLTNRRIAFYTDNAGVPVVVKKGSGCVAVQRIVLAIENLSLKHGSLCTYHWIPRYTDIMVIADCASRISDEFDYRFTGMAKTLEDNPSWPAPQVDMFADRRNAICDKFFSQTTSQGCIGVSTLETEWPPKDNVLYAFPPPHMITKFLTRCASEEEWSRLIYILVPVWQEQPWWLDIAPDNHHLREEFKAWCYVDRRQIVDGVVSREWFSFVEGQALKGHRNMFILLAWDTRPNQRRLRSQYGKEFCLQAHFTGESCSGCR